MEINFTPVATVKNSRLVPSDDYWGGIISEIELADHIQTEAFDGISEFSHLEIIYYFNKVEHKDIVFSGHPRGNPEYPQVGIFCQRKDRRNPSGFAPLSFWNTAEEPLKLRILMQLMEPQFWI